MMARSCRFLMILMLCLHCDGHEDVNHIEVSAGHAFTIGCEEEEVVPVEWSQGHNQSLDAGMKVIDQSLWFLPALQSHSGNYSCSYRHVNDTINEMFSITVAEHKCPKPTPPHFFIFTKGLQSLNCNRDFMLKISQLEGVSNITWSLKKNCSSFMGPQNNPIFRFSTSSKIEEEMYTCLVNFSLNGSAFTAALTKNVFMADHPFKNLQKPRMVEPRGLKTHFVELGSIYELHCKAFIGTNGVDPVEPTEPYWLQNTKHIDVRTTKTNCNWEDNLWYCHSNLTIKVKPEFLNVPFQCIIQTSTGFDNGTVILKQAASLKVLHCATALLIAFSLVAMGLLMFYCFKMDIVLAYRKYSPCVKVKTDGKMYDAYVSYLHGKDGSVSSASTFALKVLPEVLENQLGYKMFISGRDELPGEVVHDVISEAVGKSRRLILILPSQAFTTSTDTTVVGLVPEMPSERLSMNNNITIDSTENSALNWGPYECWVGMSDALVKESLKVILVQMGGKIDERLLPSSLRYIKKTEGIITWKQHYTTKPNGKFWKQLCYRMPPMPRSRKAEMV